MNEFNDNNREQTPPEKIETERYVPDSSAVQGTQPSVPQNSQPNVPQNSQSAENTPQRVSPYVSTSTQQQAVQDPDYAGYNQNMGSHQQPPMPQQNPVQQPQQQAYRQQTLPQVQQSPYQQQAPSQPQQGTPNMQTYNSYPQNGATNGVYHNQKPPKNGMGSGLKALLIIIIAILGAALIAFIAYMCLNTFSSNESATGFEDNGGYSYTTPTQAPTGNYDDDDSSSSENSFPDTDASDETDADYSGVKLNSKPKDQSSSKYGASYSFEKLQESVVGVLCYSNGDITSEEYTAQGTGIVLTKDGYIVTNSHVIGNSRTAYEIKVVTSDKEEYQAGVVGYDTRTDIAVLKIDADDLSPATFGDSDEIEITEDVIAIGNPRGINYQNSVTKGIVSAVDRLVSSSNNVKYIQTDSAINPGNSGGPLCNMYGQVIGITTSKISSEEYEGMGFAIPSQKMKEIVDDIIKYSYVTGRVKIGIVGTAVTSTNSDVAGIQISEISEGGPMDGTQAQVGDVVTAIDGEETATFAEVYSVLENYEEGDVVTVTLYRPDSGKSFDVEITLQADEN